jgi:hypothetical protein
VAQWRTVAILGVTHTRKPKAGSNSNEPDDPLDEVQNSTGITGGADAVLVLRRPRHSNDGKLFVTGRDLDEKELRLLFNPEYCLWTLSNGNPHDPDDGLTSEQRRVRGELRQLGRGATPAEMAPLLNKTPDAMQRLMSRMYREGLLVKEGYARYAIPECRSMSECRSDESPDPEMA